MSKGVLSHGQDLKTHVHLEACSCNVRSHLVSTADLAAEAKLRDLITIL